MPNFKRNTGFRMGFKPYVSEHGPSPFNYNPNAQYLKSLKHGMKNAKEEYRLKSGKKKINFYNPSITVANPTNRGAAKATYNKQMSELKSRYKEALKAGKKKYTLNPFKAKGFGI